jgi:predicted nucleotidyltransferase
MGAQGELALVREYKRRAERALPGRVARVVLYGSRARGEARADSDWDVAVFLRGGATARDLTALADAAYELIEDSGQFIQPVAVPLEGADAETSFARRVRAEGMAV